MTTLFLIDIIIYLSVLLLSLLTINISNQGLFGIRLKNYCETNLLSDKLILVGIISAIYIVLIKTALLILLYFFKDLGHIYLNVESANNNNQDPVRW
jgi:hypothetical protein